MVSFLQDWQKFRGWAVLSFFLEYPEKQTHINGLAKQLKISPRTANIYLKLYHSAGLLEKEKAANAVFFRLKDNALSRQIKAFFSVAKIFESGFIEIAAKEMRFNTIALFGSYAKGTNDSNSDIDLLIISNERKLPQKAHDALKKVFTGEINAIAMPLPQWRQKLKEKNGFAESVLKNHIILAGSELVG